MIGYKDIYSRNEKNAVPQLSLCASWRLCALAVVLFVMLFWLTACQNSSDNKKSTRKDSVVLYNDASAAAEEETTAIPPTFRIDSIAKFDTARHLSIGFVYASPKDSSNDELKQLEKKIIDKELQESRADLKKIFEREGPDSGMPSDFEAYPDLMYDGPKFVSLRYIFSLHRSGAAHPD